MKTLSPNPTVPGAEPETPSHVFELGDWTLREYPVVSSTNLVAARLPAWTGVRADTQTAGRGRFQRNWVSDAGGLWLSAVVPIGPDAVAWRPLPLVVGFAVCQALSDAGVQDLRMRWPNDVLAADRKLAGLLIDQFVAGLAVVGIGINVSNDPEAGNATLRNRTTRLAELLPLTPDIRGLTTLILRHLRGVVEEMRAGGFNALLPRVNELWGAPRLVELDLDGELCRGTFACVDAEGRLILLNDSGQSTAYDSHQVRHLTEI